MKLKDKLYNAGDFKNSVVAVLLRWEDKLLTSYQLEIWSKESDD